MKDVGELTLAALLIRCEGALQRSEVPGEAAAALADVRLCLSEVRRRQAEGIWVG